jgi:hypothetical protein
MSLKVFRKGTLPNVTVICSKGIRRYAYYLSAMKKTEESLRRLKKGKKATFPLFGSSSVSKDEDGKDEERIRTQMILDVEAFGKDAESLGVILDDSESYKALRDMVHTIDGALICYHYTTTFVNGSLQRRNHELSVTASGTIQFRVLAKA